MPKVVQFLHPQEEATPGKGENNNILEWSEHPTHRRKFMLSDGAYIDSNGGFIKEGLVFWGEWEAQSKVERLYNSQSYLPKYLQIPFIDPSVEKKIHNTDPYVFGKNFRYIICMQRKFHVFFSVK